MKRVLSLILVLVLALGSVPFAFAADDMTAGQELKELGLVKGDSEGELNEEGMLTRAEMMVMISRLLGVEEEAMVYAIPSTSKDVEGHWAAKYIAYAEQVGKWTSGVGENMFGPNDNVTTQMAAKFMLTALGYEANWDTAVADAEALGLMEGVSSEATANITRGEVFTTSLNTVNTPKKDSEVTLGVALGVVKEEEMTSGSLADAVIDSASAIGASLVEVEFEDDVDMAAAAAATYVITLKSDATKTIEVNKVNVESATVVTLETATMAKGDAYKVSVSDTSAFFTGIEKESAAPKVSSVKGSDTDRVEVKFDMNVDKATAEDISNYSINTIGTVTAAELTDRDTVELTVEGFTKSASHRLTVENVLSVDGKVVVKTTKSFYPTFDKSAATIEKIKNVTKSNNVEIFVFFKDAHGVDKASAEDISNYSIDGLEIISATATDDKYLSSGDEYSEGSDFYQRVRLVTSEQKSNTKYTLKVNNVVDGSTAKNVPTKELSETFYGASTDKIKPSLIKVTPLSSTLLRVTFKEENKLDPTTVLDISNYTIDKDELTIVNAEFKDNDEDLKAIDITVSEMEENEQYKLKVNNISDVFGNTMTKEDSDQFKAGEYTTAAQIEEVVTSDLNTVKVTFNTPVTDASAEEATNYSLDGDIGAPTDASISDDNMEVELTFPDLTANKTYELTVNGVETYSGYATDNATKRFVATSTELDSTDPTVESVSFENNSILIIEFSEEIAKINTTAVKYKVETSEGSFATEATATAKSVTGTDNEKLVFDFSGPNNSYADKNVIITDFIDVKDLAGNSVDYTDGDEEFETDNDGYSIANDSATIESVYQETVKELKIYFDRAVKITEDTNVDLELEVNNNDQIFTFEVDEDDDEVVIATLVTGTLPVDKNVIVDVHEIVTDLAGLDTKDYNDDLDVITYTMDIDDDTDPEIVEVVAIDNVTIEVTYDEDIEFKGSYKITEDGSKQDIKSIEVSGEVVTITMEKEDKLDADLYYVLEQLTLAKDLSGNSAVRNSDDFEFVGSDATPATNTLDGVSVLNGTTARISDDDDLDNGTYKIKLGTVEIATADATDQDSLNITLTETANAHLLNPLKDNKTYTLVTPDVDVYANTVTFKGIVETAELSVTSAGTSATVAFTLDGVSIEDNYQLIYEMSGVVSNVLDLGDTANSSTFVYNDDSTITVNIGATTYSTTGVTVTIIDTDGNPILTSK